MSLNIKNERTHELVRRLAALTGLSQTGAVEDAVRRRLDSLTEHGAIHEELRQERLRVIDDAVQQVRGRMTAAELEALASRQDDLYDEAGLPR